jgi:hypothetical protein
MLTRYIQAAMRQVAYELLEECAKQVDTAEA